MLQGLYQYLLLGRRATLRIIHRLYRRVLVRVLGHSASAQVPRAVQQRAEELDITQGCEARDDDMQTEGQQLTVLFAYFPACIVQSSLRVLTILRMLMPWRIIFSAILWTLPDL